MKFNSKPGYQLIDAYRAEAEYFRRDEKERAALQLERLADRMECALFEKVKYVFPA